MRRIKKLMVNKGWEENDLDKKISMRLMIAVHPKEAHGAHLFQKQTHIKEKRSKNQIVKFCLNSIQFIYIFYLYTLCTEFSALY